MDAVRKTDYPIGMNRITAKTRLIPLALLAAGMLYSPAQGGTKTSAAGFLKVPASAQSLGLGGNAVVSGSGISGAMDNPALLGFMKQGEFQSSYGTHLEGYTFLNAGYGHYGESFNGGLSITRVAASSFEGRDAQGAPTGGFSAADTAVNLSAGKSFGAFTGGVTFKYITSTIENESASAFAIDLGAVFMGDRYDLYPYKIGVSLKNLGSAMKYISKSEPLPLMASAGMAVDIGSGMEAVFNLSGNIPEQNLVCGVGMGLNVGGGLMLNGGLSRAMGVAEGGLGGLPVGVNAGFGFAMKDFGFNYGFSPMGEMGNVQRMSLTFKFGDKDGARKFKGSIPKYSGKSGANGR